MRPTIIPINPPLPINPIPTPTPLINYVILTRINTRPLEHRIGKVALITRPIRPAILPLSAELTIFELSLVLLAIPPIDLAFPGVLIIKPLAAIFHVLGGVFTLAVLFSIAPCTFILTAIFPDEHPLAFELVTVPVAVVRGTVGPLENSFAVDSVVVPGTVVGVLVVPGHAALAVFFIGVDVARVVSVCVLDNVFLTMMTRLLLLLHLLLYGRITDPLRHHLLLLKRLFHFNRLLHSLLRLHRTGVRTSSLRTFVVLSDAAFGGWGSF